MADSTKIDTAPTEAQPWDDRITNPGGDGHALDLADDAWGLPSPFGEPPSPGVALHAASGHVRGGLRALAAELDWRASDDCPLGLSDYAELAGRLREWAGRLERAEARDAVLAPAVADSAREVA